MLCTARVIAIAAVALAVAACGEAQAQELGSNASTLPFVGGPFGDAIIPSRSTTSGVATIPVALTINGTTVSTPLIDCRGRDAAAGGWPCTGSAGATLSKDGSTAAITFGTSGGTATALETAPDFNGAGANTDEHFDGVAGTADFTTEDYVAESLTRVDSTANLGFLVGKESATAGHRIFYGAGDQWDVGLKTASTATDIITAAGLPVAGMWEYCSVCVDRSSATGTTMMCNGQYAYTGKDLSARTASVTSTTIFSLGGDHETAARRVFNGRISLLRMYAQAAWFSSADAECITLHRARLVALAAKDYLFLGDSTTGNRISGGAATPVVQWPRVYTDNATEIIAAVNAGSPSKRCDEINSGEWATERTRGYRRVYLLCGINDVAADATAVTIEGRISTIVSDAQARGAQVVVITPMPFKAAATWSAPRQAVLDTLNTWILANSVGATAVVNLYDAMENTVGDDLLKAAYDSGDGLHPNAAGHAAMSTAVTSVIAP